VALAQDIRIDPIPPGVKPHWTQVPGTPQVSWAPNLPTDVFRYRKHYYFFWEGYFYRGPTADGPWKAVKKVPQIFYNLDPAYFKTVKQAAETPAPPAGPGGQPPLPKAKVIEIAPAEPATPAPAAPEEPAPAPQGPEAPPPKVM
jgi:hypothetical protein